MEIPARKKIVFIFAVLVSLSNTLFSQEVNISFENKVSSDIIVLEEDGTSFPGIEEKVTAEFETEKIDAGVSLITTLSTNENDILGFNDYFIDKAYIVFKPIDTLRISFNNNIFTERNREEASYYNLLRLLISVDTKNYSSITIMSNILDNRPGTITILEGPTLSGKTRKLVELLKS